ncbi:MAG: DNA topoisomerase I [Sandaracinus sp.]|nr:DNA topoisomerase I [Sandaracinus sp.]
MGSNQGWVRLTRRAYRFSAGHSAPIGALRRDRLVHPHGPFRHDGCYFPGTMGKSRTSSSLTWARRILEDDPLASAEAAGLRYVAGEEPGFTRVRWGKGFSYRDWQGRTVRDARLRERFEALVIPPAWTEVWICRSSNGHLQATGRDEAGRKQYLYHPGWRVVRDRQKYDRVVAFGRVLPSIRAQVARDLKKPALSRPYVLASVVKLLETTLVRVGNDEYSRKNSSYGLTTLRKKHVLRGPSSGELTLAFPGKSGKDWNVDVTDRPLVDAIVACLETPGWEVFKYFDEDGVKRDVKSDDVNAYLREISGANVTAKDFRTWAGTVLAAVALEELERTEPQARHDKRLVRAIERVSQELGNTPSVCRSCYVHPEVLGDTKAGMESVAEAVRQRAQAKLRNEIASLRAEEAAVLAFLEARLAERDKRPPLSRSA